MLPRPPMLTIKNRTAFKLLAGLLCAGFLAGCRPPGPQALVDGRRLLDAGQTARAIARLQTATQLLGTNAQVWNDLGVAYHQAGQMTNAESAYRRALATNPDLLAIHLNLGTLLFQLGRINDAKSELTTYALRQPNDPVGLQRLALAEVHLRETANAEQHARKAVQLDAQSPESWNTLGLAQLQRGRARDAAQSFAAAVKARRDFASALLNLAVVNQQYLGDRAAALKWYEAYLSLRPPPDDAAAVREVIKQLQLELTPARSAGQTLAPPVEPPASPASPPQLAQAPSGSVPVVKSVPPSSPPPGAKLVTPEPEPRAPPAVSPTRSVAGEPVRSPPTVVTVPPEPVIKSAPTPTPSAVAAAAPATASVPSSATVTPAVSEAPPARRGFLQSLNPLNLFHAQTRAESMTPLPAARSRVAVGPNTNSTTEEPSISEIAAGDEAQISTVSTGDRAAAQRHFERGLQAMKSRQFVLANESFRAATAADPGWFQAQLNHAAAALEAGEFAEAITAARAALALDPASAEARFNLALALKRSHRDQEAARELERLLQANPDDVRAHLTLGNLYAGTLADPARARSHYQKVLALAPGHPQATAIRFWLAAHPQ